MGMVADLNPDKDITKEPFLQDFKVIMKDLLHNY